MSAEKDIGHLEVLKDDLFDRFLVLVFQKGTFTPLEIIFRFSATMQHFGIIPTGFNTPIEFLTGFTPVTYPDLPSKSRQIVHNYLIYLNKHIT